MSERAVSVSHAEYEIIKVLIEDIDIGSLKDIMGTDKVSKKRFDKAAVNVVNLVQNMAQRRVHKLPKEHEDYEVK
jgi:hypothetical protein